MQDKPQSFQMLCTAKIVLGTTGRPVLTTVGLRRLGSLEIHSTLSGQVTHTLQLLKSTHTNRHGHMHGQGGMDTGTGNGTGTLGYCLTYL